MSVAILADIHGNLAALEAVLAHLQQVQPDLVVVNGDHINRGPQNRQVIERLWQLADQQPQRYHFVLGNHDDLVVGWAQRRPDLAHHFDDPLYCPVNFTTGQLDMPHLDWLASLPAQFFQPESGLRVAHGSPRHLREGIGAGTPPPDLEVIAQQFPAQVYVGSHTHKPFSRLYQNRLFLNSGAVGSPFNGDPRAQYLLMEPHQLRFIRVPYDRQLTLEAFRTSGLLDCGLGAEVFYQELLSARSLLTPFWIWAERHHHPRDRRSWSLYQKAHPERFLEAH